MWSESSTESVPQDCEAACFADKIEHLGEKTNEKGFKLKALRKANTIFPYIKKLLHKWKEKVISLEITLKTALLVKIQRK